MDYTRYVPYFDSVLQKSEIKNKDEIVTAIELMRFLGIKSNLKNLIKLANDREYYIRTAVARALVDLGGKDLLPVLADMVESTEEARWSLIRMGDAAVDTIAGIIAQGDSGDRRNADISSARISIIGPPCRSR